MADAAASYSFRGDPLCLWPSQRRPDWYWPAERPLNVPRRSVAEHFIGEFIELRLPQASRFMLSASKQLRHPAAKQPGLVRC
jgi:hypothetical protein